MNNSTDSLCLTGCSLPETEFTVNRGISVGSAANLTVGDVLTCSAEGAESYRWTNVDNSSDEVIHGQKLSISQPGSFSYECTVYLDCGSGLHCSFMRTISGFAGGIPYSIMD